MESDFSKRNEDALIQLYLKAMIFIAAGLHASLAAYFFITGLYVVGWINIGDIFIWIVAYFVNKSGRIRAAGFIAILKLMTYALVATYLLGPNVNVQWIILAALLPTALYLKFTMKEKVFLIALMFLFVNIMAFVGEYLESPFPQDDNAILRFLFANIVIISITVELIINAFIRRRAAAAHRKEVESFKRASYIDPLTELSNRRYADIFFTQLQQSIHDETHCAAMIDVDNFKNINDTYGHDVGDVVLMQIADILRESVRNRDLVCRWGGEEFLLILCGCSLEDSRRILDNIRKAVEQAILPAPDGSLIKFTITIGVAIFDEHDVEESIRICDKNLYEGKRSGKNKVVG